MSDDDDTSDLNETTPTTETDNNVQITEITEGETPTAKADVGLGKRPRQPSTASTSTQKSSNSSTKIPTKSQTKPSEAQPNKRKKSEPIPFTNILKNVENSFQEGDGINFSQVVEFLETTRKSTKPCEAARKLNLDIPQLNTVLRLIHPSLQDRAAKTRITKITNALRDGNENKINCLADWSAPLHRKLTKLT
ncbi:hypothetical protein U1Q18_046698 [Sarracenia purpurea var. burkii]